MSYGLLGNPASGKNDRVTFADITLSGEFTINLSIELVNDTLDGFIFSGGTGSTGFELYRRGAGSGGNGWQMFIAGSSVASNTNGSTWPYYDGTTPNPRTIEITRDAANLITVRNPDGGVELTRTHAGDLKISTLYARGTSFYRGMLFHSMEITNGAFYRRYEASASSGTGSILPTNDGVNQGTLVNFPTDDSQWIFYEGADPEPSTDYIANITSSTLLPTSSVGLEDTTPEYTLNVSSTTGLPTSTINVENAIPEYSANVSSVCPIPTSTLSLDNEVPSNTLNVNSFALLPTSSVNAQSVVPEYTLSVNGVVGLPTSSISLSPQQVGEYSASVTSSALLPTSSVDLNAIAPNGMSVTSNTPLPVSSVALEYEYIAVSITSVIQLPSSSVVVSNDIPEYTLNISSSVPLPTSNIFLVNGELIKHINPKNIVTLKNPSNFTTLKAPNNIIKLRN